MLLIAYLVLTAATGARLVSVQVLNASDYAQLAARQTQRHVELPASRGKLYDREGQPLAMSLAAATIYAHPPVLEDDGVDVHTVAAELAPLVDRPVDEVVEVLTRDASFAYLARQLPRRVGDQVEALRLPGVGVLREPRRSYPGGELAAQLIGFAGVDNVGLAGLEGEYDDVLAGRPGTVQLERAPGGLTISAAPRQVQPPVAGRDLVLTLDRPIQHVAERALEDAVHEHGAKGGSAVVLDVERGEVLAMASVPAIDPESFGSSGVYERSNRAVTDIYEPGSVSKIVTAAAALEEGAVSTGEVFSVPDSYQIGTKTFRDASTHDPWALTLPEIIARSSNVGTIKVAQRLGPDALYEYLRAFGYAERTGVGFPGEAAGLLPPVDDWWATSLPTIAIGQGVSTTLLQVATVLATVANGGERVQPSLLRGTVDDDGRLQPAAPPERRRVVSPETAAAVRDMLVGAVEGEHATGRLAAVPGYRVAGKTGTAQKPSATARGYAEGAYVSSFAGFAPADEPALAVAVMIDEPSSEFYAGIVAAPVFREITEFALGHRRIPHSEDPVTEVAVADEQTVAEGTAPVEGARPDGR